MLHRVVALILKEIQSYLRDPRTRMILFGPPIIQLFVFSFAATLDVRNVDLAIVDADGGPVAHRLIEALDQADFTANVSVVASASDARALIDRREVLIAMRLPPDLSAGALAGRSTPIQLLLDGRRANASQIATGYVRGVVAQLNARLVSEGFATVAPVSVSASVPGTVTSAGVAIRHWFNPNLEYRWFIVPSLAGMLAMLIALLVSALSIARERELGTFDQLLVSPLTPTEIVLGKSVPALLMASVLGGVMTLIGHWVFRIPFTGNALLLAASLPVFILASIGIGLAVSSVCQTQQQAILGTFAVVVPLVLTSGYATPVANMPGWLQTLSMANPLRHFLVIVQGSFLRAMPAHAIGSLLVPLGVIALVTLGTAMWMVRRRLY